MLNSIVDVSLRYKVLVLVGFLLIVVFGVQAFRAVPVDAFPDVTPVQVNVYTESPGLAAEDVEKLLTFPIETAMAGLPGVDEIRSVSLFGLSYVSVYFKDNVDIYFARRLVGEKLLEAKARIPEGYGEPSLGPNSSGLGQVFWYTVESVDKKLSTMDLRTLQDWNVRLLLRTAAGVDDVTSWGPDELLVLQNEVRQVHAAPALLDYLQALLTYTRQDAAFAHGLSPRAGLALLHGARAWAYMDGRRSVLPEDLQAVLPAVVAHRLAAANSDADTASGARLAEHLLQQVAIP